MSEMQSQRRMPSTLRRCFFPLLGITLLTLWVGSFIWLYRENMGTVNRIARPVPYGALIPSVDGSFHYGFFINGERMGDLMYSIRHSGRTSTLRWMFQARLQTLPEPNAPVSARGWATTDSTETLSAFDAMLSMAQVSFQISGERKNGVFVVRYEGMGMASTRVFEADSTMGVTNGFMPGLSAVCPESNERYTWKSLNPLGLRPVTASIQRAVSPPSPAPPGGCVLELEYGGLLSHIWVDEQGSVTRQLLSTGWELMLEERTEADE